MLFILNIFALFSAFFMIFCASPINAVLFLISTFLSVSMIFIFLNLEFIALLFIIIYVGAIAVLFLFIVMIINIRNREKDNTVYVFTGFLFFFIIFTEIFVSSLDFTYYYFPITNYAYYYGNTFNLLDETNRYTFVKVLGIILFSIKIHWLFYCGLILLIATIGAIYLTNEKKGFSMKEQINQLSRYNNLYAAYIY